MPGALKSDDRKNQSVRNYEDYICIAVRIIHVMRRKEQRQQSEVEGEVKSEVLYCRYRKEVDFVRKFPVLFSFPFWFSSSLGKRF